MLDMVAPPSAVKASTAAIMPMTAEEEEPTNGISSTAAALASAQNPVTSFLPHLGKIN